MGLLKPAAGGDYLKAGFLGFSGSGKTHTAMDLAMGVREFFGLDGPIAMHDTETGSKYWRGRVRKRTGKDLLVRSSRSLVDLIEVTNESVAGGISVLVVDSITHIWREVCEAYLGERKETAKRNNWRVPDKLDFSDWDRIKRRWAVWPDLYLNAPLHIIVCGRAGYEFDFETDERGKKELVKTGVKMKVEGEFGFEPSLLIEMERDWNKADPPEMVNRAVVIKDRFDLLNGKSREQPTFEFFKPFVELLKPSEHSTVDTTPKTAFGLDENRHDDRKREMDQREILSEKIKAAFILAGMNGKSDADRKAQAELMSKYYGTTSWKELSERTPSATLRAGLSKFETDHGLVGDDLPPDFKATEPEATPETSS